MLYWCKGGDAMNVKLTIAERFQDLRKERGLTLDAVSKQTGLSIAALSKYENNEETDISPYALATLANYYGVSTDYLLGRIETKNHSNAAVSELHLSDKTIKILSSGKINNRLLCELVEHPDFRQLMMDMEIYVDSHISDRIKDLNVLLEATRQKLIDEYHPEEDVTLRTLKMAQMQEDEYFGRVLYDDLSAILKQLKADHATTDKTTSDGSQAEQLVQAMEKNRDFKGSPEEEMLRSMYRNAGKDYDKANKADLEAALRVMRELTPAAIPQNRMTRRKLAKKNKR